MEDNGTCRVLYFIKEIIRKEHDDKDPAHYKEYDKDEMIHIPSSKM